MVEDRTEANESVKQGPPNDEKETTEEKRSSTVSLDDTYDDAAASTVASTVAEEEMKNPFVAEQPMEEVSLQMNKEISIDIVWLLENKDWEYLNYDHLIANNPDPPQFFQSLKLKKCRLDESCLLYVVKCLADFASESEFVEASFVDVQVYGQTPQIAIQFGKLLSNLFHRKARSLTINRCPQFDLKINPSLF